MKEQAKKLVEELKAGIVELRAGGSIVSAMRSLPAIVRRVEASYRGLGGQDKKALALEVLELLLPPLPWWLPKPLVLFAAGKMIDSGVSEFNRRFGKVWPQ